MPPDRPPVRLPLRSPSCLLLLGALPLQWDGAILSNRRALLELEEELRRVQRGQEGLEKKLEVCGGGWEWGGGERRACRAGRLAHS